LQEIKREGEDYSVHPHLLLRIDDLKSLIKVPKNVHLSHAEWLKLVSCIIYLKQEKYPSPEDIKIYLFERQYFDPDGKLLAYYNIANTQINKYL
jgi:hypothetical protein